MASSPQERPAEMTECREPDADQFRAGDVWLSPSGKRVIVQISAGDFPMMLYDQSRVLRPRWRHAVKGWTRVSWGGK